MGLIEDFIAEHPKEMELAQMRRREVKKLLADYDKTLREQIAREIPETIVELIAYWSEQSDWDGFHYITEENFGRILNFVAAAIARGEG